MPSQESEALKQKQDDICNARKPEATLLTASPLHAGVGAAHAGIIQDITKNVVRPELGPTDALVMMMDARGMLYELKASNFSLISLVTRCSCLQRQCMRVLDDEADGLTSGWFSRWSFAMPARCTAALL